MSRLGAVAAMALGCCAVLGAQSPVDELTTIDGKVVSGEVSGLAADVLSVKVGEHVQQVELASLRQIRLAARGSRPPSTRGKSAIILRSGLSLSGRVEEWSEKSVRFHADVALGPLEFPMRLVRAIRFGEPEIENDGGFGKYSNEPKDDLDVLSIRDGERCNQRSGTLQSVGSEKIVYESHGRLREVARDLLYGLVRAQNAGARPDRQPRPRVAASLRSGPVITGRLVRIAGQPMTVHMRLDEGIEMPLPLASLAELRIESDRLVYLTDLTPNKVEQTPAFDRTWPWMKDRAPSGEGVRLGGRERPSSIVMVPRTRLVYDIQSRFHRFRATVGIEERSRGPAHAIVRVFANDKLLFESQPLTRRTEPVDLDLDVTGVGRLTIEADFGKNFDFGDHCVFAEARLIKQGK